MSKTELAIGVLESCDFVGAREFAESCDDDELEEAVLVAVRAQADARHNLAHSGT